MKQHKYNISEIIVFTDFDGTIVSQDIGNELFIQFGEFQPNYDLLKSGKLHIRDYWHKASSTLKLNDNLKPEFDNFDSHFFSKFTEQFDIDSNFITFYKFCLDSSIKINIISDGFINYINPILNKIGISNANIFANELILKEYKIIPNFYGASESCECMCASCKRNTLITTAPPDSLIVYIGDGHSDLCAAEHSDIIFAKNQLSAYLNERRIPHYNFSNFFDVYRIFSSIIKEKKYRIRHQAYLKRKKAFEYE